MGKPRPISDKFFDSMTGGLFTNELVRATDNFSKKMVVRSYGGGDRKKMEKEGATLMSNGYMMMGQSSGGSSFWGKGDFTVTYVKR